MRKRPNRASGRCDCQMNLKAYASDDGMWAFSSRCMHHIREPTTDNSAHKSHRLMSVSERQDIANHAKVGTRPRNMLAALKEKNSLSKVILRDVYNEIAKSKREGLKGLNVAEALQEELQKTGNGQDYFWRMSCNHEGQIENLFIAKATMIKAFRDHSDILILDCTYKTNIYRMPLLNIVGVTGANTTLRVAVVFLRTEEERNYTWAMNALKRMNEEYCILEALGCFTDQEVAFINAFESVFLRIPTLLCNWHIMKNIATFAKKHGMPDQYPEVAAGEKQPQTSWPQKAECTEFGNYMSIVTECLSVPMLDNHNSLLEQMRRMSPVVTAYIESQYLGIWKHKVARCYTTTIKTFGITTISRGEGSHSTMKSWLSLSKSNIHEFWSKMNIL